MQKPRCSKEKGILAVAGKKFAEHEQVPAHANFEALLHSFFVIDQKGNFVGWNASFNQQKAAKPGRKKPLINVIDQLVYHADQPHVRAKLLSVLASGYEETAEARVLFQGQEARRVVMTGRKIMIEGNPFVMCMILDIVAPPEEDKSLNQRVNIFSSIIENMDGVVFIADCNSILRYVSEGAENIFGFMPKDMAGKSLTRFLAGEKEIQRALDAITDTHLHKTYPQILELQFQRDNASLFWAKVHLQYSEQNGNPVIVGFLHDVTLRKSLEYHTHFRMRLFEIIDTRSIEELLQAILDEVERLTESTIGFCYFLGDNMREPALEALSTNADKCFPLNQAELFVEVVKAQGTVFHDGSDTPEIFKNPQGQHLGYRRLLVVPIMNGEVVTAILGVGGSSFMYDDEHELTVKGIADLARALVLRKRAEESEKNDQLSLIQCQKMEFLGSVINRVGGNHSSTLSNMVDILNMILKKESITASLGKSISDTVECIASSNGMINQLLTFARSGAVMPIVCELNIFVEGKLSQLSKRIGENISLEWIPDRQKTLVKIDPVQIDELLSALTLNARDAITENGHITIETSRIFIDQHDCAAGHPCKAPGHYVILSVTDNGTGIDKKDLPFIFEPLFTTRADRKALGLGLSIAYGIAKQNHGGIDCQTESGRGSTFSIYLPRYMGKNYFSENEDPPPFEDCKETVLLVEEEPDILIFYKQMLEKTGYRVVAVCTPEAAITIATELRSAFDLLLTNVVLREVNGCDLSQKLLSICPNLKTLFITGDHNDMAVRCGVQNEGNGFILKPFTMKELSAAINELLNAVEALH